MPEGDGKACLSCLLTKAEWFDKGEKQRKTMAHSVS